MSVVQALAIAAAAGMLVIDVDCIGARAESALHLAQAHARSAVAPICASSYILELRTDTDAVYASSSTSQ